MGLREVELGHGTAAARSPGEWRSAVREQLLRGRAAVRAGRTEELGALFAELGGWGDPQRAYQACRGLAELVLAAKEGSRERRGFLYAAAAGALLDALEREPAEPMLLDRLGVLVAALGESRAAAEAFEAALRLDPTLAGTARNLDSVRGRPESVRLPKALAARVRPLGLRARGVAARALPANGLRISLCMIVKDEEEMLGACLSSAAPHVDEIVVVDTGSADRTVEIARSFGAIVVAFPWNGSFADARNVSLEHATGDWILHLDADERLVEGDAPLLRELARRTWREGFYLAETSYTGGDDTGAAVTHLAMRLWRNRAEVRFEGAVHEQKTQSMPTYLPERFESTPVRILHYGYLKSRIQAKDKARRNIELLERQAAEGATAFTSFNLGSEYLALGEAERARRHFNAAWDAVRTEVAWQAIGYVPLLAGRVARARREAGDLDAAEAAIVDGLDAFPAHTDLVFERALVAQARGDLEAAAALAEECLRMGDAPAAYSATVGAGTYLATALLAELRAAAGGRDEAVDLYRSALAAHPEYVAPVLPLASLLLESGLDAGALADELDLDRPSARLLAATACHEAGRAEVAERLFRDVLAAQPSNGAARIGLVESLLSQARFDAAAAEASREPAGSPLARVALVERLFAHAAGGDPGALAAVLDAAEEAGVPDAELELYGAWHAALMGAPLPANLSREAARSALVALEALLRVQAFDAFSRLLVVYERAAVPAWERHHLIAELYFRRGYHDSAADEWIASAGEEPHAEAFVGLACVALAGQLDDDAAVFADEALALDPGCEAARRIRRRLGDVAIARTG